MQDVINRLKEDPTSLSLGVQPASADYANLILTLQAAGVPTDNLRLVTYDGGGPTRNATAGGQVDVGFVGGEGFLPLKDRIKPLAMYAAQAPEWWTDVPTIADAGIETEFVEGSQRGWAVATALTTEQPEIYATIEGAVQRATENPACVEALETQELATTWYGPEESNAAFMANYEKMSTYVDLLK
jgi:putative tricarboxylic transport membrane protein